MNDPIATPTKSRFEATNHNGSWFVQVDGVPIGTPMSSEAVGR